MPNVVAQFKVGQFANLGAGNLGKFALQAPHAATLSTALQGGAALKTLSGETYKLSGLEITAQGIEGVEGHVLANVNGVLDTLDVNALVDAE